MGGPGVYPIELMDDLAEIYRRHARAVFSYARSLTRNTEEAEDLVSETFVKAVLHRNDIRTATVRGYLLTTVRNLFLNSRRRAGREVDLDEERADHSPAVDRLIDGRQLADRARVAIASLGDGERRALRLRADEGLSYRQIGEALGLTAQAAKMRVRRARARLSSTLSELEVPREDRD